MKTDSYWRIPCVGQAMDQGYTFLRLTCNCGRITDFRFPLFLRRRGVSRDTFIGNIRSVSLPEGRKHIAARRGQFPKGCLGAFPTLTLGKQRPRQRTEAGVSNWAAGDWGMQDRPAYVQFLGSRRVPPTCSLHFR
jgi:hypothetical protein